MLIIPVLNYLLAGLVLFLTMVLAPDDVVVMAKILTAVLVFDVVYTGLRFYWSYVRCFYLYYYRWTGEEEFIYDDLPYYYYSEDVEVVKQEIVGRDDVV